MGRKRYPYTKRLKLIKLGAGAEYISDDPVDPDKVLVLTTITVVDETNALTAVNMGKNTGGYFHPWKQVASPAANQVCSDEWEHWLRTGEYFQAQLVGGLAGDVCWAYLDGYWMFWEEEE